MGKRQDTFNESDWLKELARLGQAHGSDDGHMTSREIATATGRSRETVLVQLAEAKALGRLSSRLVVREKLNGRKIRVDGYKVLSGKGR